MKKVTIKANEDNDLKYRSGIAELDKKDDDEFKENSNNEGERELEYFTE